MFPPCLNFRVLLKCIFIADRKIFQAPGPFGRHTSSHLLEESAFHSIDFLDATYRGRQALVDLKIKFIDEDFSYDLITGFT